jgi:hypothetical protein
LGIVERLRRLGWAADLVVSPQPWRLKTFDHLFNACASVFRDFWQILQDRQLTDFNS